MKHKMTYLLAAMFLLWSCRDYEDKFPYIGEVPSLAYDSYSSQFDFIWKTMSTGYCLWSIDTVSWDDRYDRLMPEFLELDRRYDSGDTVSIGMLDTLYRELFKGLRDHHLYFSLHNMHPSPSETGKETVVVQPATGEIMSRDYVTENMTAVKMTEQMYNYFDGARFDDDFEIQNLKLYKENGHSKIAVCNIVLDDGRIVPYMWQGNAILTECFDMEKSDRYKQKDIPESWFRAICETPRDSIAGIILDNRCNLGGYADDMSHIVGPFIDSPYVEAKYRYKEGPGRLEYTEWYEKVVVPKEKLHCSIAARNIPFVALCNVYSCSMGEVEVMALKKAIPTCHTIGERTFGATCSLLPDCIDFSYGGPYGHENDLHYIYTPTCHCMYDGIYYEGKGYIPDQIMYSKDCISPKDHIQAALDYIIGLN